jgi:prenyltransferase beta subunit
MTRSALLLVLLTAPLTAQVPEDKRATIAFLHSLQDKSGGYRIDAKTEATSLRATSAALRALKYFGGVPKMKAECKAFVAKCQVKGGGYANAPGGKPDVVLTAIGMMAAVETGLLPNPPKGAGAALLYLEGNAKGFEEVRLAAAGCEAVKGRTRKNADWLASLEKSRNADGTWGTGKGQARDTGGHAAAVLRLGGRVKEEAVLKALNGGQRDDGGFGMADRPGSDLETTYRVMRTFHMLKTQPKKADAVKAFVAKCRNKDGGYGVTPGAPSSVAGTYFAGIILSWLDVK